MARNIFEPIYNNKGLYGLQCKECSSGILNGTKPEHRIILLAWRSPHASTDRNNWLEKKLRKVYTRYYLLVLVDSLGKFW